MKASVSNSSLRSAPVEQDLNDSFDRELAAIEADIEVDCSKAKGTSSLLTDLRRPRSRSCLATRWREVVMGVVIAVLCVVVIILASTEKKPKQLPPYCLFAVGGGYMEGSAFPQEERLSSVECNTAIKAYLTEGQYQVDVDVVSQDALEVLQSVAEPNTSQVLVFDIDETTLSNMQEFKHMKYGKKPYDSAWEHQWQTAFRLGFSVTFLTGRAEASRNATESNLKHQGYGVQCEGERTFAEDEEPCYVRLDLRVDGDHRPASVYKPETRGKLQDDGYILLASFGDQWSDLTGPYTAQANFKLPNPMYYLL